MNSLAIRKYFLLISISNHRLSGLFNGVFVETARLVRLQGKCLN
jgi:hypothetical protein